MGKRKAEGSPKESAAEEKPASSVAEQETSSVAAQEPASSVAEQETGSSGSAVKKELPGSPHGVRTSELRKMMGAC